MMNTKTVVTFKVQEGNKGGARTTFFAKRYCRKFTPAVRRRMFSTVKNSFDTGLVELVSVLELFRTNLNGREIWVTIPENN
jgi:hypothetical protein